jgi:hypothetical protein
MKKFFCYFTQKKHQNEKVLLFEATAVNAMSLMHQMQSVIFLKKKKKKKK